MVNSGCASSLDSTKYGWSATVIWVAWARIAAAFAPAYAVPSTAVVTRWSSTTPGTSRTEADLSKGRSGRSRSSRANASSATERGTRFQ